MRKLIYGMNLTLDGYIAAAGDNIGWSGPPSDELFQWWLDQERASGLSLYGRKLWETMSSYWPTGDQQPDATPAEIEFARNWRDTPKVVFSSTIDKVDWNTRLVTGDAVAEITRLKAEDGGPMGIGGATLAGAAMRAGLIGLRRNHRLPRTPRRRRARGQAEADPVSEPRHVGSVRKCRQRDTQHPAGAATVRRSRLLIACRRPRPRRLPDALRRTTRHAARRAAAHLHACHEEHRRRAATAPVTALRHATRQRARQIRDRVSRTSYVVFFETGYAACAREGDPGVHFGPQRLGQHPPRALPDEFVDQRRPRGCPSSRTVAVNSIRNYSEHGSYLPDQRYRAGLAWNLYSVTREGTPLPEPIHRFQALLGVGCCAARPGSRRISESPARWSMPAAVWAAAVGRSSALGPLGSALGAPRSVL